MRASSHLLPFLIPWTQTFLWASLKLCNPAACKGMKLGEKRKQRKMFSREVWIHLCTYNEHFAWGKLIPCFIFLKREAICVIGLNIFYLSLALSCLFIYSSIHLSIQPIFIEHLLCIMLCSRCWGGRYRYKRYSNKMWRSIKWDIWGSE